ncbi:hypothetical protein GCM10027046_21170 [Uliginosibacterium flavum]
MVESPTMWMVTAAVPPLELELLELELLEPELLELLELELLLLELTPVAPELSLDPPPPPPQATSNADSRAADSKAVNFFIFCSSILLPTHTQRMVTGNTLGRSTAPRLIGIAVFDECVRYSWI